MIAAEIRVAFERGGELNDEAASSILMLALRSMQALDVRPGSNFAVDAMLVNVRFSLYLLQTSRSAFVKSFGRLQGVRKSPRNEPAGSR
jgi:hypothetical protein